MAHRNVLLSLFSLFLILWANSPGWCSDPVDELFQEARQEGSFVLPSQDEVSQAESLFARILQGERGEHLVSAWQALGYQMRQLSHGDKPLLVLMEDPRRKEGRGFFLFSRADKARHLLMIPHGFKDVGTDVIGLGLFLEGNFAVGAWNTLPRYENREEKSMAQDLGKQPTSYFAALTRAFAGIRNQEKVFQLHGFSNEKRESSAGREAGMIVSGGSQTVCPDLLALRHCLQTVVSDPVLLYPSEIRELGGTTNISARILRTMGHSGFVHIEMSLPLRQELSQDPVLRKSFATCLETP